MDSQPNEKDTIDWEDVILRLQSFTRSLVNKKGWYRNSCISKKDSKNDGEFRYVSTYLKGKEVDDYVYEAIEKYLKNPEKHDPGKGSLVDYLNYNIIRSLVSNDIGSSENLTSKDVLAYSVNSEDDENDTDSYLDRILPHVEAYFDQEIGCTEILAFIEQEAKGDKIVEELVLGICFNGLKRREIIEEFNMPEREYDNGMRRLKTIFNKAVKRFDLKKQSL